MSIDFSTFDLQPELMKALAKINFVTPTPIQEQAIPLGLEGRDVLGSAQTGTGKTAAFALPMISKLIDEPESCGLVLTPTRELATQVMVFIKQLTAHLKIPTALLIGGEPIPKQLRQLRENPRIIVGTPGRINDHLAHKKVDLRNVEFLVLDETDRMLDMGFGVQIDKILSYMPQERQTMLFSATLPKGIVKLSHKYLNEPQRIQIGSSVAIAENIRQELVQIDADKKFDELMKILSEADGSVIVFVKTKYGSERLAKRLKKENFLVDAIHGDLRQNRRDRVIRNFREKKFQILVATDVAARGLDVPHVETVINHDLPQCPEDFIHRIGRTARAGAHGHAISFISKSDEKNWHAIHRLINPTEEDPIGFKKSKKKKKASGKAKKSYKRKTDKTASKKKKPADKERKTRSKDSRVKEAVPKRKSKSAAPKRKTRTAVDNRKTDEKKTFKKKRTSEKRKTDEKAPFKKKRTAVKRKTDEKSPYRKKRSATSRTKAGKPTDSKARKPRKAKSFAKPGTAKKARSKTAGKQTFRGKPAAPKGYRKRTKSAGK